MKNMKALFNNHKKTIMITFEIFWIIVFILDLLANQSGPGIPQFIYVNF